MEAVKRILEECVSVEIGREYQIKERGSKDTSLLFSEAGLRERLEFESKERGTANCRRELERMKE
jgi:hypothetical protein